MQRETEIGRSASVTGSTRFPYGRLRALFSACAEKSGPHRRRPRSRQRAFGTRAAAAMPPTGAPRRRRRAAATARTEGNGPVAARPRGADHCAASAAGARWRISSTPVTSTSRWTGCGRDSRTFAGRARSFPTARTRGTRTARRWRSSAQTRRRRQGPETSRAALARSRLREVHVPRPTPGRRRGRGDVHAPRTRAHRVPGGTRRRGRVGTHVRRVLRPRRAARAIAEEIDDVADDATRCSAGGGGGSARSGRAVAGAGVAPGAAGPERRGAGGAPAVHGHLAPRQKGEESWR